MLIFMLIKIMLAMKTFVLLVLEYKNTNEKIQFTYPHIRLRIQLMVFPS